MKTKSLNTFTKLLAQINDPFIYLDFIPKEVLNLHLNNKMISVARLFCIRIIIEKYL